MPRTHVGLLGATGACHINVIEPCNLRLYFWAANAKGSGRGTADRNSGSGAGEPVPSRGPTRDIPGYVTRGTQYDTWSTYQGQYSVIYRGKCMGGAVLCHFQGQVYGRGSVMSLSLRDINRTIKLESIHSSWPVSHHACCVTTAAAVSCSRRTRRRCRCSRPLAAIYPGCSSRQRFMRARCASLAQMGRL